MVADCSTIDSRVENGIAKQLRERKEWQRRQRPRLGMGIVPSIVVGGGTGKQEEDRRRDDRAWNARLSRDEVFSRYYAPERWEVREVRTLVEFLGLGGDALGPGAPPLCNLPHPPSERDDATNNALSSLFFPDDRIPSRCGRDDGGTAAEEERRELLLFTHGFVLARTALESPLLDVLKLVNSENPRLLDPGPLRERCVAVDADRNGRE